LSGQAAIEGLNNSNVVIFCVDISKSIADFAADVRVRDLIKPKSILCVATKADLLSSSQLSKSRGYLRKVFGADFLLVSSKTGFGIERLKKTIDRKIIASVFGTKVRSGQFGVLQDMAALTSRHKQAVRDAVESIKEAGLALGENNCEAASMFIRSAVQELGDIGSAAGGIDEQVLDRIFSTFCVGK
jgi:tRNA U34 5-carboxymethylaminomethyl modifying GTPase MnmE/TrmE